MSNFHRKRVVTSLNALPVFEAAAHYESFSKAAQSLNMTHGAVSRAVAGLEERLGTPLFYRRNRRVMLTHAGELLFKATQKSLDTLDDAVEKIHRQSTTSPIFVVSCEPTLAMRWLLPKLGAFYRLHPEISIDVRMAGGPIDLLAEGCDVAIRRSDFGVPNDYRITPFVEELAGPVCTDAYAKSIAQNWHKGVRFHSRTRPTAWHDWITLQESDVSEKPDAVEAQERDDRYFDHFFYSLQAAQSGLGMAIGSYPVIETDLEQGLLVAPWGVEPTGYCYQVLSLDKPTPDPRVIQLENWLLSGAPTLVLQGALKPSIT